MVRFASTHSRRLIFKTNITKDDRYAQTLQNNNGTYPLLFAKVGWIYWQSYNKEHKKHN